ncbi:Bifunctional DNA primase/polymerase [Actinobacteria bacterium OK074]|nr:Bifunctional DNA primase/polymerase [Actinobacteria bacterium OK074]
MRAAHRTQEWEDLETTALEAAARGWRVFPLQVVGLAPAVRDWQTRATTDAERIRRCWGAGAFGVGIVPCPSGLVVLDLAPPTGRLRPPPEWELPGVVDGSDALVVLAERHQAAYPTETYTVRTPFGGTHLYFTHPTGQCPPATPGPNSPLGWGIGLRTAGSYVAAAGSPTRWGRYTVVHDARPAVLPDWLAELMKPPRSTTAPEERREHAPARPRGRPLPG